MSDTNNLPALRSTENAELDLFGRYGKMFAGSKLVPQHFQNKLHDCTIAVMLARRMGEDPFALMQNLYVVHGTPGFSAKYMIARANTSGIFKGRINWRIEGEGDDLVVTAYATLRDTGEEVSAEASMVMAKAEGWTKNPKYRSMPKMMLRYRSATFLVRLYAADTLLGLRTSEELEDIRVVNVEPTTANGAQQTAAQKLGMAPPTIDVEATEVPSNGGRWDLVQQLSALRDSPETVQACQETFGRSDLTKASVERLQEWSKTIEDKRAVADVVEPVEPLGRTMSMHDSRAEPTDGGGDEAPPMLPYDELPSG